MTILAVLSGPRVGSHMTRSMLGGAPGARNIGAINLEPECLADEYCPAPEGSFEVVDYLKRQMEETRSLGRRVLVAGIGAGYPGGCWPHVLGARRVRAKFLVLYRRNKFEQIVSLMIGTEMRGPEIRPPAGFTLHIDPERALWLARRQVDWEQDRLELAGPDAVSLAYEDNNVASLRRCLIALGVDLIPAPPATRKLLNLPLETYVTNYAELKEAFDACGL